MITAPISCRSVIPPGPRTDSWSPPAGGGGLAAAADVGWALASPVPDGPTTAAGPQLATDRAMPTQRSRRMAGGSVLRGRALRSHQPESPQPVIGFLSRGVQARRVFLVAFPLALRQARRRLRFEQDLRGADVPRPRQREDRPWLPPALRLHREQASGVGRNPGPN